MLDSALLLVGQVDEQGNPERPHSFSISSVVLAVNNCQDEMKQLRHRWSYLTDFNRKVSELETGQDEYTIDLAEGEGGLSIYAARFGSQKALKLISKEQLNRRRENVVKDSLGVAITSTGDTSVTLSDSSDFDATGSFIVIDDDKAGFDTIDYTANDKATQIVSGVTNIAETHLVDAIVWQGITLNKPSRFTVFEDTLVLEPVPAAKWDKYNLYVDAYINPAVIDDLADEVKFPPSVVKFYLAWRIAEIVDQSKSANLYNLYLGEQAKILKKESVGQETKLKPRRLPDVTSNFIMRRDSDDLNT